jgi:hypothetical protein
MVGKTAHVRSQESLEAFLASQEKKKNRKKKKTTQQMLHERYKAGNPEVGLLGSCLGNLTTMSCIPKPSHPVTESSSETFQCLLKNSQMLYCSCAQKWLL